MPETKITGVRIPAEILAQIDKLKGSEGSSRSEVILTLLKRALGMESGADTATILERLDALEKKLLTSNR